MIEWATSTCAIMKIGYLRVDNHGPHPRLNPFVIATHLVCDGDLTRLATEAFFGRC